MAESSLSRTDDLLSRKRNVVFLALWALAVIWFFRIAFSHDVHYSINSSKTASPSPDHGSDRPTLTTSKHSTEGVADKYIPIAHSTPSAGSATVNTSAKVAVIVETNLSKNIVPLILHFSAVLGPSWPIIIYTTVENFAFFSTSAALSSQQRSGQIDVRSLPEGTWLPTWDSMSMFYTSTWLWEDLAPSEHIFLFQSDSIICANAARSVDDFLEYDFIGAPIAEDYGWGFFGGLSLRRRSTVLRVLKEFDYEEDPSPRPQDQWLYARLRDLEDKDMELGIEGSINLPSADIAKTFAVETMFYPNPLGLHQPSKYLPQHITELAVWCPEYVLAGGTHF